ncbi:MAG: hydrogenase [Desulfovibrionaceae bacterium]|nr:hydrogenase [Desulfovibrionaceae bacterium]
MNFSYTESVSLRDIETLRPQLFAERLLFLIGRGWRVMSLFGIPASSGVALFAVLADDANHQLTAVRSEPVFRHFESMTPSCPQLHLFERELHENWGLVPEGHPWLKPVRFCGRFDQPGSRPGPGETSYYRIEGSEVHEVAVGPVHAGVIEPGHFRFQCCGEEVMHLEIQLGFQHRGIEKMMRSASPVRSLLLAENAAGDSSVAHASAYSSMLERLSGVSLPIRARLVRRIALELERLANHTGDLGAIGGDTGFLPTASWNGRIRGDFLNLTGSICGNRFGRGIVCPGGVLRDLNPAECEDMMARLRAAYRDVRGSVDVMLRSPTVLARLRHTGRVSRSVAERLGLVGMAARASGLCRDSRFGFPADPEDTDNRIVMRTETSGDVMARTAVRSAELDDSALQAEADLHRLQACSSGTIRMPVTPLKPLALAVGIAEGWRGEVCYIGITDAEGRLEHCKITDPSFHNWMGLAMALRGEQISDFPLCNKSFNLSYCGHDL